MGAPPFAVFEGWEYELQTSGLQTVTYAYDAEGRRVRRTMGGQSVEFIYDLAGGVIAEFSDATQAFTRLEVYAPDHVATYTNSATYFIHSDWLGTERARSGVSGSIAESFTSLPFADPASISNGLSPVHFTGQEHDTETLLDHFLFRHYSSTQAGGPHLRAQRANVGSPAAGLRVSPAAITA
jgi:hypothetical protein